MRFSGPWPERPEEGLRCDVILRVGNDQCQCSNVAVESAVRVSDYGHVALCWFCVEMMWRSGLVQRSPKGRLRNAPRWSQDVQP